MSLRLFDDFKSTPAKLIRVGGAPRSSLEYSLNGDLSHLLMSDTCICTVTEVEGNIYCPWTALETLRESGIQ